MRIVKGKGKKKLSAIAPAAPGPSMVDKFSELISGLFARFTEQAAQSSAVISELKGEISKQSVAAGENLGAAMIIAESLKTQSDRPIVVNIPKTATDWEVKDFERDFEGRLTSFKLSRIENEN